MLLTDPRRQSSIIKKYDCYEGSVCGVKWNKNSYTFATGSNDNSVYVWNVSNNECLMEKKMRGGIRAIAWSNSFDNVIHVGGGCND